MAQLISEEARKEVASVLAELKDSVKLVYFTQKSACAACQDQEQLLNTLAGLSQRLSLQVHDMVTDAELARQYGVEKVPATLVVGDGDKDYGIRFFGITAGYEFSSLLEAILMVSRRESGLGTELAALLQLIDQPVHLEVMVTLTCPYCAQMVHLAHQMALANDNIRADMVESSEFPHLVQRYNVGSVPRTVINEKPTFEGALPPTKAVLEILKVVKPGEYEKFEKEIRQARGERHVSEARPEHEYDAIIVGAGPAAMCAVIYAARKNLDVALLGEHVGGQITDTGSIENWLGIPSISGQELAARFRNHAERYPVAQKLGVKVDKVEEGERGLHVRTEDGMTYHGRCVIYCAGKEYRRLNVPGESRFIGHGIAFCATCDAPLYRDKSVAVIGGGNSAFTAARDLLHYAKEIHIINIGDDFQADPVLFEQVTQAAHVQLHPGTHVKEFLGHDHLTGVRIESKDGTSRNDLPAEGVFLEIGLVPNTKPVKGLMELNQQGEIPVKKDQSTAIPGFFAAGDVTDEPEKQIVVAAASGAKAALAANRYLESLKFSAKAKDA